MTVRHTDWPRQWLMTDERMGDRLREALERLPGGAGVVLRHYSLALDRRRELARRVAELCQARSLLLAVGRDDELAASVGAALVHNPERLTDLPGSRAVHSMMEAKAAAGGAALVFVSPVYRTRSHPGAAPLGEQLARDIARAAHVPAIALGGMNEARFRPLAGAFHGWAGIDAWLR
jgi:thiamine-phosphate pyrophosphorylase